MLTYLGHLNGASLHVSLHMYLRDTKYSSFCSAVSVTLFGVYAVDLLSRWRALRGFRKTLEDDHD